MDEAPAARLPILSGLFVLVFPSSGFLLSSFVNVLRRVVATWVETRLETGCELLDVLDKGTLSLSSTFVNFTGCQEYMLVMLGGRNHTQDNL